MQRYCRLLGRRSILMPFAASMVGRLPLAMAPLGIVILIEELRGSYTSAGLVSGAYSLGTAASAPLWSALMDRVGQPRVIAGTSSASAALLIVLAALAMAGTGTLPLLVIAGCVGLTFPPIAPAIRMAWDTVTTAEERPTAYAMDAVANETIFIGGPLFLAGLLFAPPIVPLIATATLLWSGGMVYSRSDAARSWRPTPRTKVSRGRSPLTRRGMWFTLLVALGLSLGWGQVDVAMTATADHVFHSTAVFGVLLASGALGSTIGGLWYGNRTWRRPARLHLPMSLAGYAAGLAAVGLILGGGPSLLPLVVTMMLLAGMFISPSNIVQQALVDSQTAPDRRGEGQGWLITALTVGIASGTSIGGFVIEQTGPSAAFGTAFLTVSAGAVFAIIGQRTWRTGAEGEAGPAPAEAAPATRSQAD